MGFIPRRPGDEDPPHDPDTPPDSTDPAGMCPRCGLQSQFTMRGDSIPLLHSGLVMQAPGGALERMVFERLTVFECLGCHKGMAVVEQVTVGNQPWLDGEKMPTGGRMRWRGVNWWPPGTGASVHEAVPERIRDVYSEGLRCLGATAPRAAAVMFGRTLEAIVRDKGSPAAQKAMEKRLADGLEVMASEGELSKDLASWAKEVRLARNAGGHDELVDDVTPEEARNLSKLLDQLLINLYVMPARIRRSKESGSTQP